jgi:hypothetical protein
VFNSQERVGRGVVITGHAYRLDCGIKVLWENKFPKVFDQFVGELADELRTRGSVEELFEQPINELRGIAGHNRQVRYGVVISVRSSTPNLYL